MNSITRIIKVITNPIRSGAKTKQDTDQQMSKTNEKCEDEFSFVFSLQIWENVHYARDQRFQSCHLTKKSKKIINFDTHLVIEIKTKAKNHCIEAENDHHEKEEYRPKRSSLDCSNCLIYFFYGKSGK